MSSKEFAFWVCFMILIVAVLAGVSRFKSNSQSIVTADDLGGGAPAPQWEILPTEYAYTIQGEGGQYWAVDDGGKKLWITNDKTELFNNAIATMTSGGAIFSSEVEVPAGLSYGNTVIIVESYQGAFRVYSNQGKGFLLTKLAADPDTTGWASTQAGYWWLNTADGKIKFWDGASIQTLPSVSGGSTSAEMPYNYLINRTGSTYYAHDSKGNLIYSSTNASYVLYSVMSASTLGASIQFKDGVFQFNSGHIILPNKNRFILAGFGIWGSDNSPTTSGGTILTFSNGYRLRDGGDSYTYDLELRDLALSFSGSYTDSPIELRYTVFHAYRVGFRFYCSIPAGWSAMDITTGSGPPGTPTILSDFTINDARTGGDGSYLFKSHAEIFSLEKFDIITNPTGVSNARMFYLIPVSLATIRDMAMYTGEDYYSQSLTANVSAGASTVYVSSTTNMYVGQRVRIWDDFDKSSAINFADDGIDGSYRVNLTSTTWLSVGDRVYVDDSDSSGTWSDIYEINGNVIWLQKAMVNTYDVAHTANIVAYNNTEYVTIQSKTVTSLTFTSALVNSYATTKNAILHTYPSTYQYQFYMSGGGDIRLDNVEILEPQKITGSHVYSTAANIAHVGISNIFAEEGGYYPILPSASHGSGGAVHFNGEGRGYALASSSTISDGGSVVFPVELGVEPTSIIVQTSVSGEFASVTALSRDGFTVTIKTHEGSAGTTQTIYYITEYGT